MYINRFSPSSLLKLALSAIMLLLTASVSVSAKEKSRITVNVKNSPEVKHLVIYKPGQDPKDSPYRIMTDGVTPIACEIELEHVEKYNIIDFGEILEKNMTSRYADFIMDPEADISITVAGDSISVTSTGKEFNAWQTAKNLAYDTFSPRMNKTSEIADSTERANEMKEIEDERTDWLLDYYANHPMIGFALELSDRLNSYNVASRNIGKMLEIYHSKGFKELYPGHPIHDKIAAAEKFGYQISGGKYHDFNALTLDGDTVRISDYMNHDRLTLVFLWATWCRPCRKEALELIPLYEKYTGMGIDIIGIAREFGSADDIRLALEQDKHPWPTLLDLDDRFKIFARHGLSSSGYYLIDKTGHIIAASYFFNDIVSKCADYTEEPLPPA